MGQSDLQSLLDMGFPEVRVKKALKATNNAGLQPAMDWLIAHAEDPNIDAPVEEATQPGQDAETGEVQESEQSAESLRCNDCGKLFRDANAAEFHAIKTQHANFSESTEAIKSLTPEEKAAKLAELKNRLSTKRELQRIKEIEEEKERERIRRKSGQDLTEIKEKMAQKEMQKALEEKKREQKAEKEAKARIRAQIEADKKERAAKREAAKLAAQGQAPVVTEAPASAPTAQKLTGDYTDARIQIRFPDGSTLHNNFKADDTLEDLYLYVEGTGQAGPGFKLMTTFPRKVLGREEGGKSLKELQLVPSAALVLSP
ncbi:UBX-domain-containing protein [Basidiobolus meristosporus CBS 931.73]|uniref:UBX-domain-containing protein n=1 Tax=Basidiobolus meristosporus CBS 931.73 TaxID=1314790 RepID=A0A1Y1Y5Z1_9FUNG|nr:UBX-domain-containing protein [Basidiobolus meristosporus CBS 931.73]|eukprot:ORX93413.1 UBX-domain-containing protein [Basidiobolus meristosporus CBS 931.73]